MSENNTDRITYVQAVLGRHAEPWTLQEIAQADTEKNRVRLSTEGRHCAGGPDCHHVHAAALAALDAAPVLVPVPLTVAPIPDVVIPAQARGRRSAAERSLFGPIATGLVRAILDQRPTLTLIPGSNA